MPETEDPAPKESEPHQETTQPTPLSDEAYHEHADQYLDVVVARAEELQEGREDIDVEYSVSRLILWTGSPLSLQSACWDQEQVVERPSIQTQKCKQVQNTDVVFPHRLVSFLSHIHRTEPTS